MIAGRKAVETYARGLAAESENPLREVTRFPIAGDSFVSVAEGELGADCTRLLGLDSFASDVTPVAIQLASTSTEAI